MSLAMQRRGYASRIGEIALWGSAAILVLTVHIAAAALLMRQEPEEFADNGPQAAIMIELAPEPEAAIPEEEQIATDTEDRQLVETQQTEPVEEVDPIEEPPPVEPPPEVAEETPEPPPEPVIETPLPEETPPPPEIVGAEHLHRVLRGWLTHLGHPEPEPAPAREATADPGARTG